MSIAIPTTDPLHPDRLKEKQRALRDWFSLPLTLRVHRALSWLLRAHREEEDLDTRFIHLWIGFNAAYAGDLERALEDDEGAGRRAGAANERARFDGFFRTLVRLDCEGRIYKALWTRFPQEIRILLDNRYVFAPFWKHHRERPASIEELEAHRRKGSFSQHCPQRFEAVAHEVSLQRHGE
jgi:hypothetical protein